MEARPYSQLVEQTGLSDSHRMMIEAVPGGARVLDVGCAGGYVAAALRERGCTVVGIEPDAASAEGARAHCEKVVVGDFEDPAVRGELGAGFDAILMGDVLEHMSDPWAALSATQAMLAPGGRVVTSIPNIAHWSGRAAVALGRFDYTDHGLFDRTHLRFFTLRTARELARGAGYEIRGESFTHWALPLERLVGGHVPPGLRHYLARRFPTLFALQFVFTLEPAAGRAAASRG